MKIKTNCDLFSILPGQNETVKVIFNLPLFISLIKTINISSLIKTIISDLLVYPRLKYRTILVIRL